MKTLRLVGMAIMMVMVGAAFNACSSDDDDEGGSSTGAMAVDMGLPSGTKWASMNVGASHPEDYGDYFQWGETTPCTDQSEDCDWNSNYAPGGTAFTGTSRMDCGTNKDPMFTEGILKYTSNDVVTYEGHWTGKITGNAKYDAATARWGKKWQTPTEDQFAELQAHCTWIWTTINGINGFQVRSNKNGNSIFLPAAGRRERNRLIVSGKEGVYWASDLDNTKSDGANRIIFHEDGPDAWHVSLRYKGLPVRPVTK